MDKMRDDAKVMASLERLMAKVDEPMDDFMTHLHQGGHLDGSPMSLLLYVLASGVKAWNNIVEGEEEEEPFDRMMNTVASSPALSQLMMMSGKGVQG